MGRTQPHGIVGQHGAAQPSDFWCSPPYVLPSLPGPPAKSSTAKPAQGRKGCPGPLRTKLWRQHDFGGTSPTFGSRILWLARAVWIGVRPCDRPGPGLKGGTEDGGGFRMLTDARLCSLMPFFVL